jgi:Undecaprenyl-phosphate glucose phosphotransferase
MDMAQRNLEGLGGLSNTSSGRTPRAARTTTARLRSKALSLARTVAPFSFGYIAAIADAGVIFVAAYCTNIFYHFVALRWIPPVETVAPVAGLVALIVVGSSVQHSEYDLQKYVRKSGQSARAFGPWNVAFLAVLMLGFVTKQSSDYSRVAMAMFYILGYATLVMMRRMVVDLACWMLAKHIVHPRRLVIVGFEDRLGEIESAALDFGPSMELVSMMALRDNQAYLADDLALAAAAVRIHRADDVCLSVPWLRQDVVDAATAAFLRTPAEIHLDADRLLEDFSHSSFSHLGAISGLRITRPKLSVLQRAEKRAFDILGAGVGLLVLSPVLAVTAILIRLESPGPALFRQTRYGFNQEPFQVCKFRSMRAMENGANVVAAKRNDPRVTRLGAYLRRFSIDELPQLFNVLRGEMSIVGPRPHAMSHDQRYFDRLSRYARRHNVKPGITGWAQVHGHRGEIANDHQMLSRLEHDLYYVDNWSLWLDVKIVCMTVFSSKTHQNAF